jgi:hypothetical protein
MSVPRVVSQAYDLCYYIVAERSKPGLLRFDSI